MTATSRTPRAKKAAATTPVTDQAPVQPETPVADQAPVQATPAPSGPTVIKVGTLVVDAANTGDLTFAYAAADSGLKTKIRNAIQTAMMTAVMAADLPSAQALGAAQEALKTVSAPKAEIDHTRVLADRILALRYAAHRLIMGDVIPEGMDEATIDRARLNAIIDEYLEGGDADAVTTEIGQVGDKLATAKITRTTVRGSVEAHIETAFEGLAVGTVLTVAQIRTRSGAASDGAIAARLWPVNAKTKEATPTTLDLTALGIELAVSESGSRAVRKVR